MSPEQWQALGVIVGPVLGTGVGTFFGLRASLNGLRERSVRMEHILGEVRDYARDAFAALGAHDQRTSERVEQIIGEIRRER